MKISELNKLLEKSPVIVKGNMLNLGLIENINILSDNYANELDSLKLSNVENKKIVIINESERLARRFPIVHLEQEINPYELSKGLFSNMQTFSKVMITQSKVANEVTKHIEKDVIVLVIVDGLSYFDCISSYNVRPCLVEGVTKTKEGFLSIVGKNTIAQQLFDCGFFNLCGYSYWKRSDENEITNSIFNPFPEETMKKVSGFDDIIEDINKKDLYKTFVQIVIGGLDHLSHHSYDEPIIEPYIQRIFYRIKELKELIRKKGYTGVIYMTSDHGLLWRNEHNFVNLGDSFLSNTSTIRYVDGHIFRKSLLNVKTLGNKYSLLKYPYITRNLKINEWGIHGGVSAWESIVPFYKEEVF